MRKTANFANSLKRSRKEFSHARANNLAIEASEARDDVIREINSDIRNIKNQLTAIEDETYEDDLFIALKKGTSVNIRKDVVDKRHELLLELRNLLIKKKLYSADKFFDLPDDFDAELGSDDDLDTGDDIDDVIAAAD